MIQSQGSPITPVNSNSGSVLSEPSASLLLSEESDSGVDRALYSSVKALLGNINFLLHCQCGVLHKTCIMDSLSPYLVETELVIL